MTGAIVCPRCDAENDGAQEFCQKCGYGLQQTDPHGASRAPSPLELIGTTIGGKYEVRSLLGEGGFGAVYEVQQTLLGHNRQFALKLLHTQLSGDDHFRSRFVREASIAMELVHPNVIPVRDFGETDDGRLYFTMDYCRGESVKEAISREGFLTLNRTVSITRQILDVLDVAHDRQIIHRDLKPENIFLEREHGDEHVRVGDFGLARSMGDSDRSDLTRGGIIGTPRYMSPEQSKGQPLDARSDLYSLGVVFFAMISGELPPRFDPSKGRTSPAAIALELRDALPDRIVVPQALLEVAARALSPRPTDRFYSAAEFRDSLERLPTFTPTYSEPPQRTRTPFRAAIFVVAIIAAAAAGAGAVSWGPWKDRLGGTTSAEEKDEAAGLAKTKPPEDPPTVPVDTSSNASPNAVIDSSKDAQKPASASGDPKTSIVEVAPPPIVEVTPDYGQPEDWIPYRDGDQLRFTVISFDDDGSQLGQPMKETLAIGALRDGVWPVDDSWGLRRFWTFEGTAQGGLRFIEWFEPNPDDAASQRDSTPRWPLCEWHENGKVLDSWDAGTAATYRARVTRWDDEKRARTVVVEQTLRAASNQSDGGQSVKQFHYERGRGLVELSSFQVIDGVRQKIQTRIRTD